ncbi:hypothetical protein O3M35_008492 [Rhynocoris fuscipes]|uniref:MADF domain-containing protein n=1 Tax=Rhynocoris fuscipes TaxID=488301 RepID=A0AAW1D787_9HEMI
MSKSETMKFIQLYRDKQCLWYPYHENYKNQDERYEAANSIAIEMNMEGFGAHEVIRKFKNLRSSYCQELKKIKKSENSYKPKVSWFKLMDSFIKPYVHQKPTVIQDIFEVSRSVLLLLFVLYVC